MKQTQLFFLPLMLLLLATRGFAQNLQWVDAIGAPTFGPIFTQAVATDTNGNVYSAGIFYVTPDFDPGPGTFTMTSAGVYDIFVQKLDANGNFLWARRAGGVNSDQALAMDVDAQGNVYVTGIYNGSNIDFDPGAGTFTLSSVGSDDCFLWKLDAAGNFVWAKSFGSIGADVCYGIDLDATGNIYLGGGYSALPDMDPGAASYTLPVYGAYDIFVSKLDNAGNLLWAQGVGGSTNDFCNNLKVDAAGKIYATGYYGNSVDFDPGAGTYSLSSVVGSNDVYVLKLDNSGNFVWATSQGSPNSDIAYGLSIDANGNVYTSGWFSGSGDFDPGAGTFNLTSNGGNDVFLSKLNSAGNFVWAKSFGGPGSDICKVAALTPNGKICLWGNFNSTVDFDPGAGGFYMADFGNGDVFYSLIDTTGTFSTAGQIGGNDIDQGFALCVDATGNIYGAGSYANTCDFDPSPGVFTITAQAGAQDGFTMKFCPVAAVPAITGPSVVCSGATAIYSVSPMPGVAFSWSLSPASVSVVPAQSTSLSAGVMFNSPGTASIAVSASSTCGYSQPTRVTVTVNALPGLTTTSSNSFICTGQTVTLTAAGANSYTWANTSQTVTSIVVSPTANTVYTVTGKNANGCSNTSMITQSVSICTGIQALHNNEAAFMAYPNPVSSALTVEAGNGGHLVMFDVLGNVVGQWTLVQEKTTLQMDVPAGLYYLQLTASGKTSTQKLVKQ